MKNIVENPQDYVADSNISDVKTMMIVDDSYKLSFGCCSHIGNRADQQDSIACDSDYYYIDNGRAMAAVCDGMGGLAGGAKASSLCASMIKDDFHDFSGKSVEMPAFLRGEAAKLDREVYNLKNENGASLKAGTTIVSVFVIDNELYWLSVGDSHIYIIRNDEMVCANIDHNYFLLLKDKVVRGEITMQEAESNPKKEALISYLGMGSIKLTDINLKPFTLLSGDKIVLCSDGLYRTLSDNEIQSIVNSCVDPQSACEKLVDTAIGKGKLHQDNTSVVVVAFD